MWLVVSALSVFSSLSVSLSPASLVRRLDFGTHGDELILSDHYDENKASAFGSFHVLCSHRMRRLTRVSFGVCLLCVECAEENLDVTMYVDTPVNKIRTVARGICTSLLLLFGL